MLICDTHADTLHRMQYTKNTDITLKRLTQPGHTWVQALVCLWAATTERRRSLSNRA